jgi:hypothetical protein
MAKRVRSSRWQPAKQGHSLLQEQIRQIGYRRAAILGCLGPSTLYNFGNC